MTRTIVTTLSNHDLLTETARVVAAERQTTAHLIALLAEVDARGLYLGEGCSSLFAYCTQVLHLSEHAAYERITAARLARRLPLVLERLTDGSVSLAAVGLLAPHLTSDNCERLLEAARHRSKRDVERMVACIDPQPDIAPSVRRLPAWRALVTVPELALLNSISAAAGPAGPPVGQEPLPVTIASRSAPRAMVAPIAPERYLIKVTVSAETHAKLRRAQDLLRHACPTGDPAAILDRALTVLVAQLERTRFAKVPKPRSSAETAANTRRVPANVRRLVWERDAGRCAFAGKHGRCTETTFLEFHHLVPYAAGGPTSLDNLALRCRAHNAYEAVQYFGPARPGPSSFEPGPVIERGGRADNGTSV